ncbi:hypothetical protein F5Y17DRAFT_128739 [Xylariaceae sp. FL0594]|nr:hypothetical protein F5Y17DRAFT_128739 [Xylariaceae sp. FL0594]
MYKSVTHPSSLREGKGPRRPADARASTVPRHEGPLHGGPIAPADGAVFASPYKGLAIPRRPSRRVRGHASPSVSTTAVSKSKMASRPSTSGGSASSNTTKREVRSNKRISRDDSFLELNTHGEAGPRPLARAQYQSQTLVTSPRGAAVSRSVHRTRGLEVEDGSFENERAGNIGIALGSPSRPPVTAGSWPSLGNEPPLMPPTTPPISRGNSQDAVETSMTRKLSTKWNLLGFFVRRQSDHAASSISTSELSNPSNFRRPERDVKSAGQAPLPGIKSLARSNSVGSHKAPKHKPAIVRSHTTPLGLEYDEKKGLKAMEIQRGVVREPRRAPVTQDIPPKPPAVPSTGPLLDVEIPHIRMERYSIMFKSVLNSKSSFLTRRQAATPKTKSIKDAAGRKEQEERRELTRRATSAQPSGRRPGLGLFPSSRPGHQAHQVHHLKLPPRPRSNTSPALLLASSKPDPSHFSGKSETHTKEDGSRSTRDKHDKHTSRKQPNGSRMDGTIKKDNSETHEIPAKPSSRQFSYDQSSLIYQEIQEMLAKPSSQPLRNDQSSLIIESPTEIEPDDGGYETLKLKTWNHATEHQAPLEPKRQLNNPSRPLSSRKTPGTTSPHSSSSRNTSHRERSALLAPPSRPHIITETKVSSPRDVYPDDDAAEALLTPVEISIARQISISRQQRKLLQPLRTNQPTKKAMTPGRNNRRPSHPSPLLVGAAAAGVAAGAGEKGRIVETKTSKPTLVHPPGNRVHGSEGTPRVIAQSRRSERIVLEGA